MINDRTGAAPPGAQVAPDAPLIDLPAPDTDVGAALRFYHATTDREAPLTDAAADYALEMSADLPVPAERLACIRARVLAGPSVGAAAATHPAPPTPTPEGPVPTAGETRERAARGATDRHPGRLQVVRGADARPSFGRRCKELRRQVHEVARTLRVDDAVLLELERGHARAVPRAFLAAAAAFVDYDEATLARCFAPDSGDVSRMAAHDMSRRVAEAVVPIDFLTIVEESDLSADDKQYWRDVVRAEGLDRE